MSGMQGGLILLYHRVATPDRDSQLLCVSPENFERHVQILRDRVSVVRLDEIVSDIAAGRSPDGKVAITFDDGYADNAHAAAPILRRYNTPATIFATTGPTNSSNEFFWDELDRIFLSPGELPRFLRLWLPEKPYEIDLGASTAYITAEADAHRQWTVLENANPTPRHRAYRELCTILHRCTVARRRDVLEQLRSWAGVASRRTHRMMSVDELRQLGQDGLIEIGGHTVDHPLLSAENDESQRAQIRENKLTLEWIVRHPLSAFSYPFGTHRDFTSVTVSIVKEAAYRCACANFSGKITAGADLFQLPRMIVRNWTVAEFERQIERWMALPGDATKPASKAA